MWEFRCTILFEENIHSFKKMFESQVYLGTLRFHVAEWLGLSFRPVASILPLTLGKSPIL